LALIFEWDKSKNRNNQEKHGIAFEEAKSIFNDPLSITIYDSEHSSNEDRYIDLGMSLLGRLLVVAYTERGERVRLISCREATRKERMVYEER